MEKIVLIEDDPGIRTVLRVALKGAGFAVTVAARGDEGLLLVLREKPSLVLLDLMLPGLDGLSVCREIRKTAPVAATPIVMLTAKPAEEDIVRGLELGADDYVVKPFSPREVMTRIKAVLRRVSDEANDERNKRIEVAGLTIDMNSYEAYVNGKPVVLTKKEIEILWLFATNPGKVYTRDHLLENIWGYEYFGDTRTVDTHIKRIRTKLNLDETVGFDIKTVWGVGYKFEVKQ